MVKVQHAHVEEMLGSKRFGGFKRDQGTQMSPTTRSLARPSSTKDKVKFTGYTVPTFHGSDLSPMIGCLSRCRFEIDTSSYEPPPSRHLRSKNSSS